MPELDFSKVRIVGRGRHHGKARRSVETIVVDKKIVEALGGIEALADILEALAKSITSARRKHRAA